MARTGFALLLALCYCALAGSTAVLAGRFGYEADHSLEECFCCKPTPECLVNVGAGAHVTGPTDKTHQHVLFESMARELDNEPCKVEGKFPAWAAGSIFKNGFGKFESTKSNYSFLSVFDAMAYTSKITVHKDGSVRATAKLTKSDWYNRSEGINGYSPHIPPYRSFMGTKPEMDMWGYLRLLFTILPDNLNVNIVRQGKRLLGISDMDGFNEIDPNSMDYVEYFRYSDSLSMTTSIWSILAVMTSAHPVFRASAPHIIFNYIAEPGGYLFKAMVPVIIMSSAGLFAFSKALGLVTSEKTTNSVTKVGLLFVIFFQLRWSFQAIDGKIEGLNVNKYTIYKLDTSKEPLRREPIVQFENHRLSYVHELAITENYLVLAEWPTYWNIGGITNPFFNDPTKLTLTWDPAKGTKITVIDIKKGKIVSEHSDLGPYWSYHHINAYEDDQGNIVMDACTFNNGEHLHTFETRTLKPNSYSILPNINRRFVIPVGRPDKKIIVRNVGPIGFDLPIKNPEYAARKYRYAYGTGHRNHGEWWNTIVKVDMDTGKTIQWYEEQTWPSQPVFVPNPERKSEDQGLLLTLVYDGKSNRSFLLGLDGETFKEVARAWISIPLPYTSHGYFDVGFGGDESSTIIPGVKNGFSIKN